MGSNETQRLKQQYKMSLRLKAVAIAVGILGALFFALVLGFRGYITWEMLGNSFTDNHSELTLLTRICTGGHFVFTIAVIVACYRILLLFWKVSDEIGHDNSFSRENADYFHRMSRYGLFIAALYGLRTVFLIINLALGFPVYRLFAGWNRFDAAMGDIIGLGYSLVMTIVFILFCVIAESLSTLIRNAYLVKAENDLTI